MCRADASPTRHETVTCRHVASRHRHQLTRHVLTMNNWGWWRLHEGWPCVLTGLGWNPLVNQPSSLANRTCCASSIWWLIRNIQHETLVKSGKFAPWSLGNAFNCHVAGIPVHTLRIVACQWVSKLRAFLGLVEVAVCFVCVCVAVLIPHPRVRNWFCGYLDKCFICVCVCVFKSVWCVMESSISFFFRRQFATHFPRSGIPLKSLQSLQSESGTSVADVPKSTSAGEAPLAKQAISRVDSDLEWFIAFCNIWE